MKEKQKDNCFRKSKGITLIALVVTIIILIILAGVSLSLVLGENGIITIAKKARENIELAQIEEQTQLNELYEQMIIEGGTTGGGNTQPQQPTTIAGLKGGETVTEKTTVEDSDGNKVVIPEGFKIAEDSGDNVTEGIVIEDNDIIEGIGNNRGNQYVWIPVGKGLKKSDGTTVDIELGRYTFASDGEETLVQSAENYLDETVIETYFKELVISRTGVLSAGLDGLNTTALNLKGFIDSIKANGGYYIARYEASYGADGKANSKVSNAYSETAVPTVEGMLWNWITQIDAATASKDLYTTVTSDLINSYAWDTTITYIQKFSEDTDYARQDGLSINSLLTNTGENGDEICKINDMASNTMEWTTEYSTYTSSSFAHSCTFRGGYFYSSRNYTSSRDNIIYRDTYTDHSVTFRQLLYL